MPLQVSDLVQVLRDSSGLTQSALAERAETSQSAIARLEAGRVSPSIATLERLARAAGFDLQVSVVPMAFTDPVVQIYKQDIDRTLIRKNLTRTPEERLRDLMSLQAFDAEVRRAGGSAKERRRKRGRRQ